MRTALVIVSLFGLLFVTACGGSVRTLVYDAQNKQVGEIEIESDTEASILDAQGRAVGRVRGALVRNAQGARAGTITVKDTAVVIVNEEEDEIGSLENGTDCYGKTQTKLGRISAVMEPETAGAACLLLFLR